MARVTKGPRFSDKTIQFLKKASRQKRMDWLDKNREEYEQVLLAPLQNLARELKAQVGPLAPGYHFPQKGIGRIKRSKLRAEEYGGPYKGWLSYSAAVPRTSRFDHNPNLFFMINTHDDDDPVLLAGGLYMPSSRQLRSIREAIATDATAFDQLFASKDFAKCFRGGFSDERKSTRPPRGFDPKHPRIEWLKLQAFFVWRPYTKREFKSADFPELVARDCKQIVRLNELLYQAISGRWTKTAPTKKTKSSALSDRLAGVERVEREMDF